jgi:antitoxin (DNA-binding transcriptional repressor) of toxin-antitoxin stability system
MKTTNISQFKAHISEELRRVRRGEHIVILDRDIPVAEVIPYQENKNEVVIRPPKRRLQYIHSSFSVQTDPLQYLMEQRSKR